MEGPGKPLKGSYKIRSVSSRPLWQLSGGSSQGDGLCSGGPRGNPGGDAGGWHEAVPFWEDKEGTHMGRSQVLQHSPDWDVGAADKKPLG